MAYWIAMVLILPNVFLMFVSGILNFSAMAFMEGMCVVALAPAVITMIGSTFQPSDCIFCINGRYLFVFCAIVSGENRSLQYVNSINCMVMFGLGDSGGGLLYGMPRIHSKSGLSRALQWHLCVLHVH